MSYLVEVGPDQSVLGLFHSDISPVEIIPVEAIAINDADGEILRASGSFGDYVLIDGVVVLK